MTGGWRHRSEIFGQGYTGVPRPAVRELTTFSSRGICLTALRLGQGFIGVILGDGICLPTDALVREIPQTLNLPVLERSNHTENLVRPSAQAKMMGSRRTFKTL